MQCQKLQYFEHLKETVVSSTLKCLLVYLYREQGKVWIFTRESLIGFGIANVPFSMSPEPAFSLSSNICLQVFPFETICKYSFDN